ncbi:short chain dehydrogenase [Corynebacterium terpenotabidum Y-11]|uniref:Short chain dehydrogenase n=1 Tax=Corynebacterium terpenotabidum Y-11 TaxID=1200352 RepID=S4XD37_9CORY|nr:short chain dehydrogenase [Corynebacterium terpenotabidum Y-11]
MITGGARGIGLGIATELAAQGASVTLTGRSPDSVLAGVAEVRAVVPGAVVAGVECEVTDPASCRDLIAQVTAAHGGPDIVCANAGVFPQQSLTELSVDGFREVIDTNLVGTFTLLKASLAALKISDQGRFIMTSSITGPVTGYPGWTHYAASKAGQLGMMRTAAIELAPHGVTVNAVLPGNVLTAGLEAMGEDYVTGMAASVPVGRLGTPREIGAAVAFLASPGAGYITGQTITVDGGQTLPESPEALEEMRELR